MGAIRRVSIAPYGLFRASLRIHARVWPCLIAPMGRSY